MRAFIIATLLGVAATIAVWIENRPRNNVGPTAATLDDAARFFACVLTVLVVGPVVALLISPRRGRLWTALGVVPVVGLLSFLVLQLR